MSKILIIEDETAIQSILVALLTDAGYTTEVAGDGLEGITKFREKNSEILIFGWKASVEELFLL